MELQSTTAEIRVSMGTILSHIFYKDDHRGIVAIASENRKTCLVHQKTKYLEEWNKVLWANETNESRIKPKHVTQTHYLNSFVVGMFIISRA